MIKDYITGCINDDGTISPMGNSKDLEYAKEIAKRHDQKVFKIIEITDYSQGETK